MAMKWYEKAKRLMADKNIKQKDLINVLGVATRGAVGHYLTGRRNLTHIQLKAMCEKLDCSMDELMDDSAIDPVQSQIARVMRLVEKAIEASNQIFTEEERLRIYRVAFTTGLDSATTESQLREYLASFVK